MGLDVKRFVASPLYTKYAAARAANRPQAFEELERTSSRKQLTAILANLLRDVDADEIAQVAYLLQGRVAPLYEPIYAGF